MSKPKQPSNPIVNIEPADLWIEYFCKVYPPDTIKVTPVQEHETHLAFLSGMLSAQTHILSLCNELPEEVAEEAVRHFMDLTAKELVQLNNQRRLSSLPPQNSNGN